MPPSFPYGSSSSSSSNNNKSRMQRKQSRKGSSNNNNNNNATAVAAAAQDPKALRCTLLERRQQESIQIRKQRREERLEARRLHHQNHYSNDDKELQQQQLEQALESYVISGRSTDLVQLSQICSSGSAHSSTLVWGRLCSEQPAAARTLISHLSQALQQQRTAQPPPQQQHQQTPAVHSGAAVGVEITLALYNVLHATTSTTINTTTRSVVAAALLEDSYYGHAPLRWSDLLLEDPHLIPLLCSNISTSATTSATTTVATTTLSHILGNLLQDSPTATCRFVWPHWSDICACLPHTSYLCAALAQKDATCWAADLVRPLSRDKLAAFLTSPEIRVDGAWFWEGITRREDSVVYDLCHDDVLMLALASAAAVVPTEQTATVAQNDDVVAFLFPVVKTIGNMAVACDGTLVSRVWNGLGDCIVRWIHQGTLLEAVRTAACFLVDVPHNPSSNEAWVRVAPSLMNMILLGTYEWKREAAVALDVALSENRPSPINENAAAAVEAKEQGGPTMNELVSHVWDTMPAIQKSDLFMALLDVVSTPDSTASRSAMKVFDRLVRMTQDGVDLLVANHNSTVFSERLQDISSSSNQDGIVADMCLVLLEEFFDDTTSSDDDDNDHAAPAVAPNGTFVFGMPHHTTTTTTSVLQQSPLQSNPTPSVVVGRGRGRPIPAWMAREQQ